MRIFLGIILLGLAFDSYGQRGGTPPTIAANPATADFNFPLDPATGKYPATVVQTF